MKTSDVYAAKLAIGHALAGMGMRAVTISEVAGTKPADSRETFRRVTGKQSSSGQTPTYHQWFLQSKIRRMHGAALCLWYVMYRQAYEGRHPNPHGIAFLLAYKLYRQVLGAQVADTENDLTGERLHLLIGKGFERNWRQIPAGAPTTFDHDNLKIMQCRRCRVPHLVAAHHVSYDCGCDK